MRGREEQLGCDYLGAAWGLVPNLELARLLGCEVSAGAVVVDDQLQTRVPRVHAVGELLGIGGVDQALVTGGAAGLVAAEQPSLARWSSPGTGPGLRGRARAARCSASGAAPARHAGDAAVPLRGRAALRPGGLRKPPRSPAVCAAGHGRLPGPHVWRRGGDALRLGG
ncbi:FAD-dependent oxidoreductase [Pyxidicoccus sp. 3LG]